MTDLCLVQVPNRKVAYTGYRELRRIWLVLFLMVCLLAGFQTTKYGLDQNEEKTSKDYASLVNRLGRQRTYSQAAITMWALSRFGEQGLARLELEQAIEEWEGNETWLDSRLPAIMVGDQPRAHREIVEHAQKERKALRASILSEKEIIGQQREYVRRIDQLNLSLAEQARIGSERHFFREVIFSAFQFFCMAGCILVFLVPVTRKLHMLLLERQAASDLLADQAAELEAQQAQLTKALQQEERTKELFEWASRRLESLFQAIPTACFTVDMEGTVQEWNLLAETLWGVTAPMAVFRPYDSVFSEPPVSFQELATGQRVEGREVKTTVRGVTRWVFVTAYPLNDPHGNQVGAVVAALDTTERREQEERLRLFSAAVDAAKSGIVITDLEERITYVNRAFTQLTKRTEDQLLGQIPGKLLQGPDSDPTAVATLRGAVQNFAEATAELINYTSEKDPYWVRVSISPVRDASGKATHYMGVQEDVTARKSQEEAIAKSEKLLQTITDKMSDGVLIQDYEGKILFSNPVSERILELSKDELVGKGSKDPQWRLIDQYYEPLGFEDQPSSKSVMQGVTVIDQLVGLQHIEGKITWLSVSSTPIESEGDRPWALVTFSDVTEEHSRRERLERELSEINDYSAQLAEVNERLSLEAVTDVLTGLPNRRGLEAALGHAVEHFQRFRTLFAFALMDVDRFKQYNDSFGHPAGDRVLEQIGSILRDSARTSDIPCRYGGEEFGVILHGLGPDAAIQSCERIRRLLEEAAWPHREITASIGVACYAPGMSIEKLIELADEALYQSKAKGRNCVTLAENREAA